MINIIIKIACPQSRISYSVCTYKLSRVDHCTARVSVHFVSVHRLWPVAINIVVFIVDNYGVIFLLDYLSTQRRCV